MGKSAKFSSYTFRGLIVILGFLVLILKSQPTPAQTPRYMPPPPPTLDSSDFGEPIDDDAEISDAPSRPYIPPPPPQSAFPVQSGTAEGTPLQAKPIKEKNPISFQVVDGDFLEKGKKRGRKGPQSKSSSEN